MKKKLVFLLVAVCLIFSASFASAVSAEDIGGSISTRFLPKYVLGDGAVEYGKPLFWTNLSVNLLGGFYVSLDDYKSLRGGQNLGNEVDLTGGYSGWLSEKDKLKLNVGLAYDDLAAVGSITSSDILNPFAEISLDVGKGFVPYVRADIYLPANGKTAEGTSRWRLGTKHSWQINKDFSLNQEASVIYATAVNNKDGLITHHYAALTWMISKKVSIDVMNDSYFPINHTARKTEIVPAIGLTYRF